MGGWRVGGARIGDETLGGAWRRGGWVGLDGVLGVGDGGVLLGVRKTWWAVLLDSGYDGGLERYFGLLARFGLAYLTQG